MNWPQTHALAEEIVLWSNLAINCWLLLTAIIFLALVMKSRGKVPSSKLVVPAAIRSAAFLPIFVGLDFLGDHFGGFVDAIDGADRWFPHAITVPYLGPIDTRWAGLVLGLIGAFVMAIYVATVDVDTNEASND